MLLDANTTITAASTIGTVNELKLKKNKSIIPADPTPSNKVKHPVGTQKFTTEFVLFLKNKWMSAFDVSSIP